MAVNDAGPVIDRAAYAGFWRRFAAYAIDYALLFLASALLAIAGVELGLLPEDAPQLSVLVLAGYLLYCALLESSRWQATLGKLALGIKVTSLRGERIGFGRAVARFVARLLSVLTLCLGYLLIVVTKRRVRYRRTAITRSARKSPRAWSSHAVTALRSRLSGAIRRAILQLSRRTPSAAGCRAAANTSNRSKSCRA
jgi:uncharacterized RDD family membrane protein YckC